MFCDVFGLLFNFLCIILFVYLKYGCLYYFILMYCYFCCVDIVIKLKMKNYVNFHYVYC